MDEFLDKAAKLAGLRGSLGLGLLMFLGFTVFNPYRSIPDFSEQGIFEALGFAVVAIGVVQIAARATRASRKYLVISLASCVLFYLVCWTPVFEDADGRYDPTIALLIWASITAGCMGLPYVYDRTDPSRK